MTTSIVDLVNWATALTIADGNDLDASTFLAILQTHADRAKYLKDLVEGTSGPGVRRVWQVASIAALKAVTAQNDGDVIYVESRGFYMFDSASAVTTLDPIVVTPTTGPGRWFLQKSANMIVDEDAVQSTTALTTASAAFVDVTGMTITLTNAEVGDVILWKYDAILVKNAATTDYGDFRCVLTENGGAAVAQLTQSVANGADWVTPAAVPWQWVMGGSGRYVSTVAGPVVVKLQWCATAGTMALKGTNPRTLSAMLVRP